MFLKETRYSLNELQRILAEKANNEFKPKFGKFGNTDVPSENNKNNEKAVKDIIDNTGAVTATMGGLVENGNEVDIKQTRRDDPNKGMLNIRYVNKPNDSFLENNVEANVKGYTSKANMDSHKNDEEEKDAKAHKPNEDFYEAEKDRTTGKKGFEDLRQIRDKEGLGARTHEDLGDHHTAFDKNKKRTNESKTMKRLHFKNTTFLSEAQMLNKVPEEYKTDGNRFYMRDNTGTDYLVECIVDDTFNTTKLTVLNKINKGEINEQIKRMQQMYDYNSSDYFTGTSVESRKLEEGKLGEMLDMMKRLGETKK